MKILNKKQMLDAPENTLFFSWEPNILSGLSIKTGNRGGDDIWASKFECGFNLLSEEPTGFNWELYSSSFGLIQDDDQFAVFENHEIESFIEKLKKCLK